MSAQSREVGLALILGIPAATVKTRMFYARKKLAELVQERKRCCAASAGSVATAGNAKSANAGTSVSAGQSREDLRSLQ